MKDLEPRELADLHNLLVVTLRSACNEKVNDGGDALEVRDGLGVTGEWDAHFTNLYAAQPKTLIWIALRHAMLGNPLEGEITEWSNNGQKSKSSQNSVGMLAGAGALGLLAGFLWG